MHWYVDATKKYAVFSGRARRKEYWMYFLINFVINIVLLVIGMVIGVGSLIQLVYLLVVLLPSLGLSVRRLHDTGRSGWWILISLVPLVGWIVVLVFMTAAGTPESNAYGPNPKLSPAP